MDWDTLSASVKLGVIIFIFVLFLLLFHVELRPLVKVFAESLAKVLK